MKKNYFLVVLTLLFMLCAQVGYTQTDVEGGELGEVIIDNPYHEPDPEPEPCFDCSCDPVFCSPGGGDYPTNPEPEPCYDCSCDESFCNTDVPPNVCTLVCLKGFELDPDSCQCNPVQTESQGPCMNRDLRHKKVSSNVAEMINQRSQWMSANGNAVEVKSFEIQNIEDGYGDINLDRYDLGINKIPNGYTPQMLFEEIRTNFSNFVTGGDLPGMGVDVVPYSPEDGLKWNSSNPIGAAMDFDNSLDTSTVICTEYNYNEMYWNFTTVRSADHLGHFVSGTRQFGMQTNSDGSYSFYLRGADRLGQAIDFGANNGIPGVDDFLFNQAADATWKNLMTTLENYIKAKTGAIVVPFDKDEDYAKRYEYNQSDCPE
ncbi:hypothetical protein [Flavobacterium collinsii]|uniref:Uncharacterized protein n=1 Tax=Flavobacterium collinsii TaxID=1114861 RepID=A0A9W4TJL6_9FLAO|nr:hypothetical protein [Flavobacterium collinsii]CAA9198753.1 hypothetical protein FLACOL7796_02317 [Flavobacterium collinsii]CAI2768199.1 conserved exported protein of unknown function [Flavobacterium collinsii]